MGLKEAITSNRKRRGESRLMTTSIVEKSLKKEKLRYNEYYNMQEEFDKLYQQSKSGKNFTKLLELITDERNIMLAYRTIKSNTGSKTQGTNGHTIEYIANQPTEQYIEYVKARLRDFKPHSVRRVEIPKANGKTRPLGIPTIEDRLIQQCIKQVLEPICEAKFHNKSYGFRENRSTEHAIAMTTKYINLSKLYHIVDIDIKGFFDNVNHSKLIKQMWTLGIRDKNLLCIISKMLKAEIEGEGKPTKGTPQGGILSPLLSNIVLNELDWWVSDQWETFNTRHNYQQRHKYRALKTTKLKEFYIVRYADDFKILCRDKEMVRRMFFATKLWLKERLSLEISEEKSKVVDVTKSSTEFLGFSIKAKPKGKKLVAQSHMSDKAKEKFRNDIKEYLLKIQKHPTVKNVNRYNSMILGKQEYYKIATQVNIDMNEIAFLISRKIKNRTKQVQSKTGYISKLYKERYNTKAKKIYVAKIVLFPIGDIKHKNPMCFSPLKCNYTSEGRKEVHDSLKNYNKEILKYIMENPIEKKSAEYNDNRLSLYTSQKGRCVITRNMLTIGNMEVHHKIPKVLGGTDEYKNLMFITGKVHKLIHATKEETMNKYFSEVKPDKSELVKINKLREQVGNLKIIIS